MLAADCQCQHARDRVHAAPWHQGSRRRRRGDDGRGNDGLLNEGIGAGYLDRHWPPAFKESGAWPLGSLRQSLLNGTLTRLIDPDPVLRGRIAEFVSHGEFGLASGAEPAEKYRRVWFHEDVSPVEIAFEADV